MALHTYCNSVCVCNLKGPLNIFPAALIATNYNNLWCGLLGNDEAVGDQCGIVFAHFTYVKGAINGHC